MAFYRQYSQPMTFKRMFWSVLLPTAGIILIGLVVGQYYGIFNIKCLKFLNK